MSKAVFIGKEQLLLHIMVHEGLMDIVFHGERPPLALFCDLREFIGLSPEEWGLESWEALSTVVSVYPSKPLSTDHTKISCKAFPAQMLLHYVMHIPFYIHRPDPNLHFDRLIIPTVEIVE